MSWAAASEANPLLQAARAALAAACVATGAPATSSDVYGLVVGIDDYEHLSSLRGAVNDARDVAAALESMAARDVRLLLNGDATRKAIFRHWDELTRLAGAGDLLVFHFAGHGGRQDAVLEGHEEKDNLFLLSAFEETGDGAVQRIVDNEIGHMLAMERETTTVFVADSCFAGGMVRGADDRLQASVRTSLVQIARVDDAVSERVRELGEVHEDDLAHVIWIYGQDENKVTQEVAIEGKARGALSHMFSRALRGEADADGDGRLDVGELKRFVSRGVLQLTERRQRPEVNAGSADLSITLAAPFERPRVSDVPVLRIFYADARPRFGLEGVTEVRERHQADILYSARVRELVYRTGDIIAAFDPGDSAFELSDKLQGAVDKWRLIEMLAELGSSDDLEIELSDGDRVYVEDETVRFRILSRTDRSAFLFNLAYDGTVQVLAGPGGGNSGGAGIRLRAGQPLGFTAKVQEPFGADHLVAVTTSGRDSSLLDGLPASHGTRVGAGLAQELAGILDNTEFGVSWVGLFTRGRGGTK